MFSFLNFCPNTVVIFFYFLGIFFAFTRKHFHNVNGPHAFKFLGSARQPGYYGYMSGYSVHMFGHPIEYPDTPGICPETPKYPAIPPLQMYF